MTFLRFPRPTAVSVYLIVSGVGSAAFSMYAFIASVYRIVEVGLDPLELVLVGTVLEVAVFLFEVPTGIVADVYGRRLSLVLGSLLVGAAFIVEGLVPLFWSVLFAQVLFGVGATFRSGAWQAWIADELGNEGVGRVYLRGSQASRVGAIVGIGIGVVVSSGYPSTCPYRSSRRRWFLGGLVTLLLGLFMAKSMPEDGFRPVPRSERKSWRTMVDTFVRAIRLARRRPEFLAVLSIALFYGASSEPFDRFWELHILEVTSFALPAQAVLGPTAWWGIAQRRLAAPWYRRRRARGAERRRRCAARRRPSSSSDQRAVRRDRRRVRPRRQLRGRPGRLSGLQGRPQHRRSHHVHVDQSAARDRRSGHGLLDERPG